MKYTFSKHTHWKGKDEIVSIFNSFRLRPVYLSQSSFCNIRVLCEQGIDTESTGWKQNSSVLEVFRDYKIIVQQPDNDTSPLEKAKVVNSETMNRET